MTIEQSKNETLFSNKYGHGKVTYNNTITEISIMHVELKYRNQGYGKKLMGYILDYIKIIYPQTTKIILSPLPVDNYGLQLNELIEFYKKFGFKECEEYPQDKPYLMECTLNSSN